jgi:hypothetical protein
LNSQRSTFRKKLTIAVAVTSGAAMTAGGLQFANAGTPNSQQQTRQSAVATAFAKTEHLSVKDAHERLATQGKLVTTAKKIDKTLKPDVSAGDYIDTKSGKLTVNVTSQQHAPKIDAPNTTTRVVTRSTDDLNKLKKSIDRLQEKFTPRGVTYYIDVRKNAVSVTVARNTLREGKTPQFVAAARKLGPAVHINTNGPEISPSYGMKLGSAITSLAGISDRTCSLGWWVKDKSDADLLMTAGHCTKGTRLWYQKALHIGGVVNSNNGPMDWGTIHVDDIAAPRPTTQVLLNDDNTAKISGLGKAPVGTQVCKTGDTTHQTCGPITAHDGTIVYDGTKLEGLSTAKLVSDKGDSGGPVYQMDPNSGDHVIAQGILSGGSRGTDPDADVMFYQPIASAVNDGDLIFVKSQD